MNKGELKPMLTKEEIQMICDASFILNHLIIKHNKIRAKYLDKTIENHPELFDSDFVKEHYMLKYAEEAEEKDKETE